MNPFEIVARLAQVATSDDDLLDLLANAAPAPPEDFVPSAPPAATLPPQGVPAPAAGGLPAPVSAAALPPSQGPFGPGPVGGNIPTNVGIPGLPEGLIRALANLPQGGPGGQRG